MAFTKDNLQETAQLGNNRVRWYYYSSDTLATCLGTNYFATGGGYQHYFHVGDLIEIAANSGQEFVTVEVRAVSTNTVTVIGLNGGTAGKAIGWTPGTGTPNKGAFAADTATAVQAGQRILAIEQALRVAGIIN